MLVGTETEVLDGLAGVLGSTEEDGVGSSRRAEGELVEGEALTTSGQNASAGASSEPQSGDGELGHFQHSSVIGDGSDNDNGLALVRFAGLVGSSVGDDAGDG